MARISLKQIVGAQNGLRPVVAALERALGRLDAPPAAPEVVLGLADGLFPLGRSLQSLEDEEEERRLFYVAVTRARRNLYLCAPLMGRGSDRRLTLLRPSRFISELMSGQAHLLEKWQIGERRP